MCLESPLSGGADSELSELQSSQGCRLPQNNPNTQNQMQTLPTARLEYYKIISVLHLGVVTVINLGDR